MNKKIMTFLKTPLFRIGAMIFTLLCITLVLTWEYKSKVFAEVEPDVLSIEEQAYHYASIVNVGMHIQNFSTFSFHKNSFVANALIWFKYVVGSESLDFIEDFSFENGTLLEKSRPYIKLLGDSVIVSYQIKLQLQTSLNHHHFPIGDHRMNIILYNQRVTPHEMIFKAHPENFELSSNLMVTQWVPVNTNVRAGCRLASERTKTGDSPVLSYPCVVFSIDFENNSMRDLVTLYLPLFAIFFTGFFSLVMPLQSSERLSFIVTSTPILVLYNMVINAVSPLVGDMTKADFVFFLLVILSLFILFFQLYVSLSLAPLKEQKTKLAKKLIELDDLSTLVFLINLVVLILAITYNTLLA